MFLPKTLKVRNGLLCADVPLRNYSLTHPVDGPSPCPTLDGDDIDVDVGVHRRLLYSSTGRRSHRRHDCGSLQHHLCFFPHSLRR